MNSSISRCTQMQIVVNSVITLLFFLIAVGDLHAQSNKNAAPSGAGKKTPVLTLEKLAQQSDVIAVGTVTAMESEWNDDRSRIQTRVRVAVDEGIKGTATESSIIIVIPGGEVDGIGELYTHSVKFQKNEDVVVFAGKDDKGQLTVTNGEQGKFLIQKDTATGKKMIPKVGTLEEFKGKIKNSIKTQKQ